MTALQIRSNAVLRKGFAIKYMLIEQLPNGTEKGDLEHRDNIYQVDSHRLMPTADFLGSVLTGG